MRSASKIILALAIFSMATALPTPQLAGEGQAADSLFTDIDSGVGYGIEAAEDNIANSISGTKGASAGTGGSSSPPPPPPGPKPHRRQLDKVAHGEQAIADAAGVGSATQAATDAEVNADGELTSGAANAGATIGGALESTLIKVGQSVPRV
ncbi:hypothetical protein E8E13_010793 [Curvularia kusanoi]|uniref:Uncharacterized protein n=1 Tax=Curvularia kusanoi TaxID=90978 RepID=A0A9P4TJ43_CURKU|nr:hypothetical protein E8E13_010793 [Curvularia kusanoi]